MKNLGWKIAGVLYALLQATIAVMVAMILARFDKMEAVDTKASERLDNHETRISHIEGKMHIESASTQKQNENTNQNRSVVSGAGGRLFYPNSASPN